MDSQSTMDIFCKKYLAEKTTKSKTKTHLKSNCGTMTVSHKATVTGYHNSVWFSEKAITNIIALINLRTQYPVTYRSNEMLFIVHQESKGKPNMKLQMHESGTHYFDPRDE